MHDTIKAPKSPQEQTNEARRRSIIAATVAAAVAGLLIVVFLQQYRDDVNADAVPSQVVVAGRLISQGASGDTVGAAGGLKTTTIPRDQLKAGAITDASTLRGLVAAADILPGQQLTRADFKPAGSGVVTKLAADQRAITIAVDSAHSLGGQLLPGNRVDVLTGFVLDGASGRQRPVLQTLMQDVLVLNVPAAQVDGVVEGGGASGNGQNVTLRVSSASVGRLAFAADNGQIWLVLRPEDGRNVERPPLVSLASLLAGTPAIKASGR